MNEELLRLDHLSIDYKVKDGYLSAVNDVSCVVNKGEVFAIVGESGCGKSTVAHSVMTATRKSKGRLFLRERIYADMVQRKWRTYEARKSA